MIASNVFAWHDGFLLGYPPLDLTHLEFVTLVEALRSARPASFAQALDAVAAHCREHFASENAWMVESDFPSRQCHIEEHAAVLRSVDGVARRVAQGHYEAGRRLGDALADWFPGHADYLDSALAAWMCKRRFGGKPVVLRRDANGDWRRALRDRAPE